MRLLLVILLFSGFLKAQNPETVVFRNGDDGYKCYRIPAIVKASNGHLLAFAEGRRNNCGDFGYVEIVMKRSTDNGQSWSKLQIVADFGEYQAGNPAPVFDLTDPKFPQGRLFLFYNTATAGENDVRNGKGLREVWYKTSTDNGQTWSNTNNITTQVSRPNRPDINPKYNFKEDWRTYANTPGHGLQIQNGKYRGRIFIAANHSMGVPKEHFREYHAHGFYSDNHGKSFKISPDIPYLGSNEATAAETSDGSVLLNCRNQSGDAKFRIQGFSSNGGKSWDEIKIMNDLPDPVCEGSIINYTTPSGQKVLLFSNLNSQTKREKLTLYESKNDGKNWRFVKEIYAGSAAYSDLVIQNDNRIGVLYEKDDYTQICYTHFMVY